MFLRTDREEKNVWHIASFRSDINVMQRLWELAKERLTTEEIKNETFLRKTMREGTPGT